MTIGLPSAVERAIERLNRAGYEAYAVGGCVRDTLLGIVPKDWDITTSALPEQVAAVFAGEKTIPTGIRHGTLTVVLDAQPLEITTYRVDGAYSDNRHPDAVSFTRSLREDLARRDFTVNALAYHPATGIVDCFSGLADLDRRRIVCVGDPERRFTEDALRILRALRFSASLGFSVDKATADAAHRLSPLLRRVSAERIAAELAGLLCGAFCKEPLLRFADVLTVVLPELEPMIGLQQNNPYHYLTVYEHTVETVAAIEPRLPLRLAMLLHDCGKPQCYTRDANGVDHFHGHPPISAAIAEQALERLRFDQKTVQSVKTLIQHHDDTLPATDRGLLHLLRQYGPETATDLIAVQRADVTGQHPDRMDRLETLAGIARRLQELIGQNACYSLPQLRINGNDLKSLGCPTDGRMGALLNDMLTAVIDGVLPNDPACLRRYAQEKIKTD